jgi:hypothetical protein
MVVPTIALTDLDRATQSRAGHPGLPLLAEAPYAFRFGAGRGSDPWRGKDSRTWAGRVSAVPEAAG